MNFTSVEVKIQDPPAGLPIGRSKREGTDHQRSEGEPYCGADPKAKRTERERICREKPCKP